MEQKLHTPEGVRDIYHLECKRKLALQNQLHHILQSYGYQDIQTPTFEYFDVFRKEIGTIPSKELYKFFDREGNTLVLRPDLTPSIARAAATLYEDETHPVRLCYEGNTFINHSSYQGRLKENTQMGAELIGDDSEEADAEILALIIDGLQSIGLKEFQLNIGHVDFINSLLAATNTSEDVIAEIHSLIGNRNYFGVQEVLERENVSDEIKDAFNLLPELVGGMDILIRAADIAVGQKAKQAIVRLLNIYEILTYYGVEKHITFDLSMSGTYGYYTGIVFRAYTYGTGDAIVRGGRYDQLMEKFGKQTPSIGFAIIVDELMLALSRQKIKVKTDRIHLIFYTPETLKWAVTMAKEFRAKGKSVELIKCKEGNTKEQYKEYGRKVHAVSMLFLNMDQTITMINLVTGQEKLVTPAK